MSHHTLFPISSASNHVILNVLYSLRASSPIWASEASLLRTRKRGASAPRLRILVRFASLAHIGELARRLSSLVLQKHAISHTNSHLDSSILSIYDYRVPEDHNPEQATSMRSHHSIFTDQFIYRMVLAQILNIF